MRARSSDVPRPVARAVRRSLALLASASWLCGLPVAASAQTPPPRASEPIALTWSAPPSCPDRASVSARIAKLLGGPPTAADRRLDAVATVEEIPRGFRLEITLTADGAESGRILQGALCESVADAAALVIALAFDPEAVAAQELKQSVSETPSPDDTPAPAPAPTDSAAPPAPPAPAATAVLRIPVPLPVPSRAVPGPPVETPSLLTYAAFAQLSGDAGSLPSVAAGIRAGLSLGIGPYRIEPAFEAWPSSRSALANRPDAGADLRLVAGSLDVCRRLWPWDSPTELGLSSVNACLGFEIGEMRGSGFGVDSPRSAGALWAAPRGAFRAELSLVRNVALTLDLGLAIPLDRRRFVLTLTEGSAVVHEPSPVSGRAGAGVAVRF